MLDAQGSDTLDSILCRLCGRRFRSISNTHLVSAHGFAPEHPIDDYKNTFGIERAECEETRQSQVRSLEETWGRQGRLWSGERVLQVIAERAARGAPLNSTRVRGDHPQLILAARKFYGSWDRALEAAGLDASRVRVRACWTHEAIVGAIRSLRAAGALRRQQGSALGQAARRAFGSWNGAILAAAPPSERPIAVNA